MRTPSTKKLQKTLDKIPTLAKAAAMTTNKSVGIITPKLTEESFAAMFADKAATVTPKPMLQQAQETISGPREQEYGNKLQNFSQIAMIWQGILAPKLQLGCVISPEDVALLMIGVKMARLSKSPDHFDSILDVAGYAGCYSHLQEDRKAGKELLGATEDSRWAFGPGPL